MRRPHRERQQEHRKKRKTAPLQAGIPMQQPSHGQGGERSGRTRRLGQVSAAKPGGDNQGQPRQSSSSSCTLDSKGSEITYFSMAQLPRSISRHRSLQKGISGSSNFTSF